MKTGEKIFKYIENQKVITSEELAKVFGISRQAVHKHLKILVKDGKLIKDPLENLFVRKVCIRYI